MSSICNKSLHYTAESGHAVIIEHYSDKPFTAWFWRVLWSFRPNGEFYTHKDFLKNKPTAAQIRRYLEIL